jgi:hypothetical protein
MGLFDQIVDRDIGRDLGVFFRSQFTGAQGPLGAGLMAGEAVEDRGWWQGR